jgi:hypothetical protein
MAIDPDRFFNGLERLKKHWFAHDNFQVVCINDGDDIQTSHGIQLFLFNRTFDHSILLITKQRVMFMLDEAYVKATGITRSTLDVEGRTNVTILFGRLRDNIKTCGQFRKLIKEIDGKVGSLSSEKHPVQSLDFFTKTWRQLLFHNQIESVNITTVTTEFLSQINKTPAGMYIVFISFALLNCMSVNICCNKYFILSRCL